MKIGKMGLALALSLSSFFGACALGGCSAEDGQSEEPEVIEDDIAVIGNDVEGAVHMKFVNETGSPITNVVVAQVTPTITAEDAVAGLGYVEQAYAATWADQEKIEIFALPEYDAQPTTPVEGDEATTDTAASQLDDLIENALFNITITLADGTEYTLHNISFAEGEEVTVRIDAQNALAYITYTDEDGNEVSMLEAETAVVAAEQARLQAEAEAQAAAEAEAAAAAQAAQQASSSKSSGGSGYSYSSGGSGSGGASQSEDVCVDDIIFND